MNTSATFFKMMLFVIAVLSISSAHAQQGTAASINLIWVNAPASLPAGAKLAMLQGDLAKPGTLVFRLKLPAGYQLKPQSSPAIDRMMVISGALNLGSGDKFDNTRTIPLYTGYAHWPNKSPYFAFTKEETVIEIEGVGPWAVTYVNPADDPMKKRHVSRSAMQ